MYRQRKRDLNLKPNRQLDKRSSRGMIYENEELRMRTIAICEDVDKGQTDIKKLRKENDHLKREIWGLRDECEKLEKMLKRVCISANIPQIQLESSSSKTDEDDDEDDDEDYDDEEENEGRHSRGRRKRKESGASVMTYDSEMGSSMYGDEEDGRSEDIAFAADDTTSVINQPGVCPEEDDDGGGGNPFISAEVVVEPQSCSSKSSVFDRPHTVWGHAAVVPDLEAVREETESNIISALNSPITTGPVSLFTTEEGITITENFDILPDPNVITIQGEEGMKFPVIHITPACSPPPVSNDDDELLQPPQFPEVSHFSTAADGDSTIQENYLSMGCITVVPKTFKATSEIVVSSENQKQVDEEQRVRGDTKFPNTPRPAIVVQSKSVEFSNRPLPKKQDSDPTFTSKYTDIPSEHVVVSHSQNGGLGVHRRSCYLPAPGFPSTVHRSFGVLGCCCSDLLSGYQSEPSLNSPSATTTTAAGPGGFASAVEETQSTNNFFNALCCRMPVSSVVQPPPLTLKSVWNTVDKNIVIGFYERPISGSDVAVINEPKVQEVIDEVEAQFDPTLENILGIRIIPGRIFISLKNSTLVQSFLVHFKEGLVLRKGASRNLRIHFIEGTAKWSTLILSGIPQELSDLAVISALNQFGQVVAPLERRNYKGVDISERIAKMHLVISESNVPKFVNVSGYNVRIRVEIQSELANGNDTNKLLKHGQGENPSGPVSLKQQQQQQTPAKYGFVTTPAAPSSQNAIPANNTNSNVPKQSVPVGTSVTAGASGTSSSSTLKPHKPVIRSSSSAPRLETPATGTLSPLPTVEAKRQASVCVANIPVDQHPNKLLDGKVSFYQKQQQQVTIAQPPSSSSLTQAQVQSQASSTPNLQPAPKKPLSRLLVSSPGSFTPVLGSPTSPSEAGSPPGGASTGGGGGVLRAFYRNFDPRRGSAGTTSHGPLTPSSSYSPKGRRKSSVAFASGRGSGGKKEPLPWCGCWGVGCGYDNHR